jgi:hypothetical protein
MGHAERVRMRDFEHVAIAEFVVREFRLHAADGADQAARIVAALPDGLEPPVPLLRNIDDHRDVAIVSGLRAGEHFDERELRVALAPLVASWQPARRYGPRISESAESRPSSYRLAVTESGINGRADEPGAPVREATEPGDAPADVGLVGVGVPIGSFSGLMVLLGSYDDQDGDRPDPRDWPLALARQLQVRIYETAR